jgi:glycyl-tRNA synthetase alpha subunit
VAAVVGAISPAVCFAADEDGASKTRNATLMQQMDHQRRVDQHHRAETGRRQVAAVTDMQEATAGVDYVIAGLLGMSALALYVAYCRRNRRPRDGRYLQSPHHRPPHTS